MPKADQLIYYRCWQRVALFADELSLVSLGGTCKILREVVNTAEVWELRIEDLHKAINQRREEGRVSSSDSDENGRPRRHEDGNDDGDGDDTESALKRRIARHVASDPDKNTAAKNALLNILRKESSSSLHFVTLNPLENDLVATAIALSVSTRLKRLLMRLPKMNYSTPHSDWVRFAGKMVAASSSTLSSSASSSSSSSTLATVVVEPMIRGHLAHFVDGQMILLLPARLVVAKLRSISSLALSWVALRVVLHYGAREPDFAPERQEGDSTIRHWSRVAFFLTRVALGFVQKLVVTEFPSPRLRMSDNSNNNSKMTTAAITLAAVTSFVAADYVAPSLWNTQRKVSRIRPVLDVTSSVFFRTAFTVADCFLTSMRQRVASFYIGFPCALVWHCLLKRDMKFGQGCMLGRELDVIATASRIGAVIPFVMWCMRSWSRHARQDLRRAVASLMKLPPEFVLQSAVNSAMQEGYLKGITTAIVTIAIQSAWTTGLRLLR